MKIIRKKQTQKIVYAPQDLRGLNYLKDLGPPGKFPFTRGIYPTMYAGKPWTMREFAGFGLAHDTNKRFHFLLNSHKAFEYISKPKLLS